MPSHTTTALLIFGTGFLTACFAVTQAAETLDASKTDNHFEMTTDGVNRCFTANGLPDHPTGTFPNRGNPNAIAPQDIKVCVPLTPVKSETVTAIRGTMGIAINGVQFRPNTAGFYDPNGRRGHSRNGDRNWSLDIHGAPGKLGLDFNNAHVGRGGLYHYHGIAENLLERSGSSLIGYAGDGYEIHYVDEDVQSGWELREGVRPSGPGGAYDGTFNEDYIYTGGNDEAGKARLDVCNGGLLGGRYVYFVTNSYPFLPRCFTGVVSGDFNKSNHRAERQRNGRRGEGREGRRREGGERRRRGGN